MTTAIELTVRAGVYYIPTITTTRATLAPKIISSEWNDVNLEEIYRHRESIHVTAGTERIETTEGPIFEGDTKWNRAWPRTSDEARPD